MFPETVLFRMLSSGSKLNIRMPVPAVR